MPQRGRRPTRVTGDERQESILVTMEHLLEDRSFDDISIDDLASGAGISRPTFYFYFSSKDDVLLALLDRTIREVEHRVAELPRDFESDPEGSWRRSIAVFVDVFSAHSDVSAATTGARLRNPSVNELWSRAMSSWADYSTEVIVAERARGAAPAGIDAKDLSVALNLMNERVLTAVFTGDSPAIDRSRAVDTLSTIWLRSIYGTGSPLAG